MNDDVLMKAAWAWHPEYRSGEAEYLLFRRTFECRTQTHFELAVSADARYNLFLDGKRISRGPCRGDLLEYHFECCSGELSAGVHVLAAEVVSWRLGFRAEEGVWSEVHNGGGFFVAGSAGENDLSTPGSWRCMVDGSRRSRLWKEAWKCREVIPAPPMEEVDFSVAPGPWLQNDFDDSGWAPVRNVGGCALRGRCEDDPPSRWQLAEREIPQLREVAAPVAALPDADGCALRIVEGRLCGRVPAGRHTVLADLGRNRTSMFHFTASGGKGTVRIAVAEALFVDGRRGRRDVVPGGRISGDGYADFLHLTESACRFDSFWYRAGRFVEFEFELSAAADIEFWTDEIGYPFDRHVEFECEGFDALKPLFDVAWNTALGCAHEHYEDCPYFEQLQYAGDTRIQALISYAVSGDGRLGRQAIRQFDHSRLPGGLTQSRYPSNTPQVIPLFSLYWILMIEDYFDYFGDLSVIREHLNGMEQVLNAFERLREPETGLIGSVRGCWGFTDWVREWPAGCSGRGSHRPETILNLVCADACRAAARLCRVIGAQAQAKEFLERRTRLIAVVNRYCFDPERGCYADVPGRKWFSCHANIWALLAGAADPVREEQLLAEILHASDFSRCTLFFNFYLLELLRRKREIGAFEELLGEWTGLLEWGFTTFPEIPNLASRSDCHAWSASPAYEIVRTYFGVSPLEPGFARVLVEPQPGRLRRLSGTVPVGQGRILGIEWSSTEAGMELQLTSTAPLEVRVQLPGEKPRDVALRCGRSELFRSFSPAGPGGATRRK